MRLSRPKFFRGGETLRRGFLRGREGGRSSGFVALGLSENEGGGSVRFRVAVDISNIRVFMR